VSDPILKRATGGISTSPGMRASQKRYTMALETARKQEVVTKFRTHPTDTGSPEVQVALITERINGLTEHFKTHLKDHHSRRGLLLLVSQRKSLLEYLKKKDSNRYKNLIKALGLRR